MMRRTIFNRIFRLLLALPAMAGLAGCGEQEAPGATDVEDGYITLRLSSLPAGTRVTAGEDTYNENAIHRVELYFFTADATETDEAVHQVTGLEFTATGTLEVPVKLPINQITPIFGNGNTCKVLALVNLPAGNTASGGSTLKDVRKRVIETDFTANEAQADFVMYGEAEATLSADRKSATGSISLKRAAAKMRLAMRVADEVTDENGNRWTPGTSIHVFLSHGTKKAHADGSEMTFADEDYFSISPTEEFTNGRALTTNAGASSEAYPYSHAMPLYSYPNRWENTPTEKHRTYLTLQVPWRNTTAGATQYRNCYYQVPVNVASNQLAANTYYRINLSVNMLGSFAIEEPMELNGQYQVVNWGEAGIDVDIHDNRYLVVNQTDYVMNNAETITIPFFTSHATEVSDVKMTYYRYNETDEGAETAQTITPEQNELTKKNGGEPVYQCTIDPENNTLTFQHPLIAWNRVSDSDGSEYFVKANYKAYSRYEMEITIRHEDQKTGETQFKQTIKIVQYPGMYITLEHNSGGGTNNRGYVFVNNSTSNSEYATLGGVHGLTGGNKNPNMYIINLTQLNETDGYTIADPRSLVINNDLSVNNNGSLGNSENTTAWSDFARVTPKEGGNRRRLAYYYPTDESATKANYIAPQIRVASSYGVTYDISRTNARRRCASYQEQGYPAGRWRVPSKGEMEYIVKLSSSGKIPVLFSIGETYWSAQGPMKVPEGTGNLEEATIGRNDTHPVRCVYDEWYWKNEDGTPDKLSDAQKGTFTWGDATKDSPQQ